MRVSKRAEKPSEAAMRATFVPIPSLMAALGTAEHQVLYGRRGTGKTHVLRYLADDQTGKGNVAVYVDLSRVGSSEDLYSTAADKFDETATNLLVDIVQQIHESILEVVVGDESFDDRLGAISVALDRVGAACTSVKVVGEVEVEDSQASGRTNTRASQADAALGKSPRISGKRSSQQEVRADASRRQLRRGRERFHLLLGELTSAIRSLSDALGESQLWLFLDEWSTMPPPVQPLVADLLRRSFFSAQDVVVKISAIERRSRFFESLPNGNYIGIELGADTSSSLDLDDFLLFRNERTHSHSFMATLLYRHLEVLLLELSSNSETPQRALGSPNEFVTEVFSSGRAFDVLVLAAEGVPRDALQIIGLAAAVAGERAVSANDIQTAARDFYLRDKEGKLDKEAQPVLNNFINDCVEKSTRNVYLRRHGESDSDVIQSLYDARLVHRVQQGVSLDEGDFADTYDVYVVDYGCFVQLLNSGQIRNVRDGLGDSTARFISSPATLQSKSFARVKWRDPRG